jgi:sugar lactone lactonase YvrE
MVAKQGHRTLPALLAITLIAGCASRPHLPGPTHVRVWPAPPEKARIALLGVIRQPSDVQLRSASASGFLGILSGTPFGRFENPYAIAVHGAQEGTGPGGGESIGPARMAIADTGTRVVHFFDFERRRHRVLATYGEKRSLESPVGVAFDASGRLYVCDSVVARIVRYRADGAFDRVLEGRFARPAGIAIDRARNRLYVSDAKEHAVYRLGLDGSDLERLRLGLRYPTHLAVDAAGRLVVSDSMNFRVVVLDAEGNELMDVGAPGDRSGNLQRPKGVALDRHGHLFVVDAIFDNVQIFDLEARLLLGFGSAGDRPGEFALPAGLAIDERDVVYVADTYNGRVQVFQLLEGGDE